MKFHSFRASISEGSRRLRRSRRKQSIECIVASGEEIIANCNGNKTVLITISTRSDKKMKKKIFRGPFVENTLGRSGNSAIVNEIYISRKWCVHNLLIDRRVVIVTNISALPVITRLFGDIAFKFLIA